MMVNLNSIRKFAKRHLPQPIRSLVVALKHRGGRLPGVETYRSPLKGKRGIEVGGPSSIFETYLPVYQVVGSLDGVNFATKTLWEGQIREAGPYRFHGWRRGRQYVADATNLAGISSASYDFVLSSNCLEHVANPLKALFEWCRVLKPGGVMVLVLPNKKSNFDHRRPVTEFQHLVDDYRNDTDESDLTHVDEILRLHDLTMDPPAGDPQSFKARCLDNLQCRALHHHVFDLQLMRSMCKFLGLAILDQQETETDFLVLARKPD